MNTKQTDLVTEYLREVDQRLAGLPVLQRRELLADLAAHIESERVERNLASELELIEVLERLGSPEVVAAAAREEADARPPLEFPPPLAAPPPMPPPSPSPAAAQGSLRPFLPAVLIGAGLLIVLFLLAGLMFVSRAEYAPSIEEPPPAQPTIILPS